MTSAPWSGGVRSLSVWGAGPARARFFRHGAWSHLNMEAACASVAAMLQATMQPNQQIIDAASVQLAHAETQPGFGVVLVLSLGTRSWPGANDALKKHRASLTAIIIVIGLSFIFHPSHQHCHRAGASGGGRATEALLHAPLGRRGRRRLSRAAGR